MADWKSKLQPVSTSAATATAPAPAVSGYKAKLKPVEGAAQQPSTASAPAPKKSFLDTVLGGAQKVSDFFGGKGLSDLAGTTIAKATVPAEEKQYVSKGPTDKEVLGSALEVGSLLFPVGRAASAVTKIAKGTKLIPQITAEGIKLVKPGKKLADIAGKVISGGAAGATYDVGNKLQGEDTRGAGTIIGSSLPLLPPALKSASKLFTRGGAQTVEDVAGRVVQGNTKAQKIAAEALTNIDTKGVKTYDDLANTLTKNIEKKAAVVEGEFAKNPNPIKLPQLTKVLSSETGKAKGKVNYVKDALTQLSDLYKRTKDLPKQLEIKDLLTKARTTGLTPGEINQLAKDYGTEFKAKGFSKVGQALTNVNDQAYENTRKGLKELARSFLTTSAAQDADRAMSKLLTTQKLVSKMQERINALEQRIKERGFFERAGRVIGTGVDLATGGALKGFLTKFFPSNVGLKTMNAIDLENELSKNLKLLTRLSKAPDSEMVNFLKYVFDPKNSATPGDVLLRRFFGKD